MHDGNTNSSNAEAFAFPACMPSVRDGRHSRPSCERALSTLRISVCSVPLWQEFVSWIRDDRSGNIADTLKRKMLQ
jgi:hypothetical protein